MYLLVIIGYWKLFCMSGHSKWSTIKRQKGREDQKRGQIFTKLANSIAIAVREGGGIVDPQMNPKLRLAIDKAKAANMPKDNIDRAIARGGAGVKEGEGFTEILYEGFGPESAAILVEAVTDNKNRTQSEVRNVFERGGGRIASPGAVQHFFTRVGIITIAKENKSLDTILEIALRTESEDVEEDGEHFIVYTKPDKLHTVKTFFENIPLPVIDSLIGYRPLMVMQISEGAKSKLIELLEALEELESVQDVFTNAL